MYSGWIRNVPGAYASRSLSRVVFTSACAPRTTKAPRSSQTMTLKSPPRELIEVVGPSIEDSVLATKYTLPVETGPRRSGSIRVPSVARALEPTTRRF